MLGTLGRFLSPSSLSLTVTSDSRVRRLSGLLADLFSPPTLAVEGEVAVGLCWGWLMPREPLEGFDGLEEECRR